MDSDPPRRENNCSMFTPNAPHFFKIIFDETIQDGKLGIPKRFWRKYGSGIPSLIELRVPSGAAWKVELTKSEGNVWLHHGWREFAVHYSLKFGHFLVFRYDGNGDFHVLIFDTSASEINYPHHITNSSNHGDQNRNLDEQIQQVKVEEAEDDDDVSVEIWTESEAPSSRKLRKKGSQASCSTQPSKKRKTSSTNAATRSPESEEDLPCDHPGGQQVSNGMQKTKTFQEHRANILNRARAFKSKNPFYSVIMKPSYIKRHKITVPGNFRENHFKNIDGDVILRKDGKTWPAKYHFTSICQGWRPFVNDNNLEVGDVCVFELIKSRKASLNVFIYRVNEDSNSHSLSGNSSDRVIEDHPSSFEVVLSSTSVDRNNLIIPLKKVETLCDKSTKSWTLKVGDKTWPVTLLMYPQYRWCKFSAGWQAFKRDNCLKAGDTCVFEVIEKTSGAMKVSFIRTKDTV